MKLKLFVISILPLLFCGCATLTEHASEIESTGQAMGATAPVISAINPIVGMWCMIVGGTLVAIGTSFKKKGK